jgi:hypothetical protein
MSGATIPSYTISIRLAMMTPKRPRDPAQLAKLMIDIASGEAEDREPTPEEQGKDPAAVQRGRLGGLKGGKARAEKLTPAERSNLTVRMHTRRFTRLTNGFSKKVENHAHSVALFAMYYNFVRVHKTLRVTPAMAANVTKRLWEISDIVDVLEAWEAAI